METVTTDDNRSYHISSEKISKSIDFETKYTIEDSVQDLLKAFLSGKLPNSMEDTRYFNIKRMQEINLQ